VRRRDGTFNYSADVYCSKYDETTGLCPDGDECPYLHRTAGDTERRYHLKYYKTGMCVHDTDNRGFCVKNGPHCAFAHGTNDLRPAVYDIRELQAIENGETDPVIGPNSLDKERCLLNDDPKWLDTTYVLANYKTEPCKKPPRLCRQGYACPQYHNNKDKRRSPKKYKYRSTPCPNVKSGDEWGDPVSCEAGDACQYCHTRTEQQFHPEIYKSTKCNDIQNTSYCPRGAFCAFAHVEQETVSLESPPTENGHSLSEIISTVLPENGEDSVVNGVSNNAKRAPPMGSNGGPPTSTSNGMDVFAQSNRAPGSQFRNGSITPPFEENGVASPIDVQKFNLDSMTSSLGTSIDSAMVTATTTFAKNRFLSGDHVNAVNNRDAMLLRRQLFAIGNTLDELSLSDPFDGNKSRKSSGFSSSDGTGLEKTRQYSGYDMGNKSRNCSGNSISAGLVCSGILNGSSPVMIPSSTSGKISPPNNNKGGSPSLMQSHNGITNGTNSSENGSDQSILRSSGNQLGLFDLTSSNSAASTSNAAAQQLAAVAAQQQAAAAVEVGRLKDELLQSRARMATWEEGLQQARNACEVWKKEATIANKKAELAMKEKDQAMLKLAQMQKEIDNLSGGPHLHVIRRVQDLKTAPVGVLKTIEWQLKKDLEEVEKVMRAYQHLESNPWMGSNGGGGLTGGSGTGNNRFFDFSTSGGHDWSMGLISNHQSLYGPLAQQ